MSRAPQGLEVTKALAGAALADPEVDYGSTVSYTLTVTNHGPDEVDVDIYDEIGQFASVSFTSVESGGVTGNTAGPAITALDDVAVTMPAGSEVVYTLDYVAPAEPYCGTIANVARVMNPAEKLPVYVAADPVFVGLLQSEVKICKRDELVHSEFLYHFLGTDLDRFQGLQDLVERNFTMADLVEWVTNIAASEGVAPPPTINPNL